MSAFAPIHWRMGKGGWTPHPHACSSRAGSSASPEHDPAHHAPTHDLWQARHERSPAARAGRLLLMAEEAKERRRTREL